MRIHPPLPPRRVRRARRRERRCRRPAAREAEGRISELLSPPPSSLSYQNAAGVCYTPPRRGKAIRERAHSHYCPLRRTTTMRFLSTRPQPTWLIALLALLLAAAALAAAAKGTPTTI